MSAVGGFFITRKWDLVFMTLEGDISETPLPIMGLFKQMTAAWRMSSVTLSGD
jgi:hypothetical protein